MLFTLNSFRENDELLAPFRNIEYQIHVRIYIDDFKSHVLFDSRK